LSRFISVIKPRPIIWQNSHSYVLCDRFEDLTPPNVIDSNPKCDRAISLYGYVRGSYLKENSNCHLLGVGDSLIANLSILEDPVKIITKQRKSDNGDDNDEKMIKRRSLSEKDRLIYAPMTSIGDVIIDSDATYIELKAKNIHFTNKSELIQNENKNDKNVQANENNLNDPSTHVSSNTVIIDENDSYELTSGNGQKMMRKLQDLSKPIDEQLNSSFLKLFKNSQPIQSNSINRINSSDQNVDNDNVNDDIDSDISYDDNDRKTGNNDNNSFKQLHGTDKGVRSIESD